MEIHAADEAGAHVFGLQTCGSWSSCTMCGPKVREGRAQEIREVTMRHVEAGGSALFVTLTMSHGATDSLDDLWTGLQASWAGISDKGHGYRRWKKFQTDYGIEGVIRAFDVTHGDLNGWHPHLHCLFLTAAELTEDQLYELKIWLYEAWSMSVFDNGWGEVSWEHGIDVSPVRCVTDVGAYLAKVTDDGLEERGPRIGAELARSDLKRGRNSSRTPLQILADVVDGTSLSPARDLALWHEWERVSKGKWLVTWSHGLKARYGIGAVTDQEHADAVIENSRLALSMDVDTWHRIAATAWAVGFLLQAVDDGDREAVDRVLDRCGVPKWLVRSDVAWARAGPAPPIAA